jgi:hypothetical protein
VVEVLQPGVAEAVHTTSTDATGHFAFPFVLPGTYDVRARGAAGSGLGTTTEEDVVVGTGTETSVSIALPDAP